MKVCLDCGSLCWETDRACRVCGGSNSSDTGEAIEDNLAGALLLAYHLRPHAFNDFHKLSNMMQDILPSLSSDTLVMSAVKKTLPLFKPNSSHFDGGYVKQSLSAGRFPYPESVASEVLIAYERVWILSTKGSEALCTSRTFEKKPEIRDNHATIRVGIDTPANHRPASHEAKNWMLELAYHKLSDSHREDVILKSLIRAFVAQPDDVESMRYLAMRLLDKVEDATDLRLACALLVAATDSGDIEAKAMLNTVFGAVSMLWQSSVCSLISIISLAAAHRAKTQDFNDASNDAVADNGKTELPISRSLSEAHHTLISSGVNDAESEVRLGDMLYYGDNAKRDYHKAVEHYKRAAAFGSTDSIFKLGICYERGNGVRLDLEKAKGLYAEALSQGNHEAGFRLGWIYLGGVAAEFRPVRALSILNAEVKAGRQDAIVLLAMAHEAGVGVQKDFERARALYKMADSKGPLTGIELASILNDTPLEGAYYYANALEYGTKINKDLEKAVALYQLIARYGHKGAKNSLQAIWLRRLKN